MSNRIATIIQAGQHLPYSFLDLDLCFTLPYPYNTDSLTGTTDPENMVLEAQWETSEGRTTPKPLTDRLEKYFVDNFTIKTEPLIIMEAHKCVFRGSFNKLGPTFKKQKAAQISSLLDQI